VLQSTDTLFYYVTEPGLERTRPLMPYEQRNKHVIMLELIGMSKTLMMADDGCTIVKIAAAFATDFFS
jgi:hypothetical protein